MTYFKSVIIFSFVFLVLGVHSSSAGVYDALRSDMEQACPVVWEDLGVALNSALPAAATNDIWQGDSADKDAFKATYASDNSLNITDQSVEDAALNLTVVAEVCASYRIAMLDQLVAQTPVDVSQAMISAGQSISTQYMGWLTGDVRVTARTTSADGWVLLYGQTIGAVGSGADLEGAEYQALFEIAKTWAGNTGAEVWGAASNGTVALPDLRGRAMYGRDNMGGVAANVISSVSADQVGGAFGSETSTIGVTNMPVHNHPLSGNGSHAHTLSSAGAHKHKLKSSIYAGSSSGGSGHPYFEGKGRPNYQNTIQDGTDTVPSHTHNVLGNGSHSHTVGNSGNGTPLTTMSPGMSFNVEMKL